MKKLILLAVACLAMVGCNSGVQESPEQMSIEAVYSTDSRISSNSKTAAEVVAKMQSVRLVGCPPAFVDAYKDYIRAWEKLSDLEKKMYTQNMQKAVSDVATYISNFKSTDAVVELKKAWPAYATEIDSTTSDISKSYTNVMTVGARYNAVLKSGGLF